MKYLLQAVCKGVSPILLLSVFAIFVAPNSSHGQFTDSLWVVGGQGNPGDSVQIEVWLQYEGGGASDSMASFDIPLAWDAAVCTVEAITMGPDFSLWTSVDKIDNAGTEDPVGVSKILISAYTFGPPAGPPYIERGTHLAATVDFRILDTANPGDSTYVDTLIQAFFPPKFLGFVDKAGLHTYVPAYGGGSIVIPTAPGDVGATAITSPPDTVDVGSDYAPSAWVSNFGADAIGPIPVVCLIDGWADTVEIASIPGLDSATATFTNWTVPATGTYSVAVFTDYSADTDTSNDSTFKDVEAVQPQVPGDVGPGSIIAPPDTVYVGNNYVPSAMIKNFGIDSAGPIPVVCSVNGWVDTVEILSIPGLDSATATFADWSVPDTGTYTVTIFTEFAADTNLANDTLTKSVEAFMSPGDVGPVSIASPPDTVYMGSDHVPSAMVRNFGADPAGPIPVICTIDGYADTAEIPFIAGLDSAIVNFNTWTVPDTLVYTATFITEYLADTNVVNDTIVKSVQSIVVPVDVGPSSITGPPDSVYSTFAYTPSAWVVNYGMDPVDTVLVVCVIDGIAPYEDSVEIPSIPGMDSATVDFADWTVPDTGAYTVTVYTEYLPDGDPSNDTISKPVYATVAPVQYSDSAWVIGGEGNAGELVSVEVWLQYNGDGTEQDSISSFGINLRWNADICTVEAIHIGDDFEWTDASRIDNQGVAGPPDVPKMSISAFTFGPPVGGPYVERGTHLAATVDFRILSTIATDDSTYVDSLLKAFSPSVYTEFTDKRGIHSYTPSYMGGWIIGHPSFCDVGPVVILSPPDTVDSGATYTPSAVVANFGADPVGPVPVICTIDGWADTAEIPTIPGLDSAAVIFTDWTAPGLGDYQVAFVTEAVCDTNTANDTLSRPVHVGVDEFFVEPPMPSVHALSQSYPNPMSTTMSISYQLPHRSPVSLKIFDNTGRLIRVLVEAEMEPGYYTAKWNGRDGFGQTIPNGIYFYRLEAGDYTQTRKFIKLR